MEVPQSEAQILLKVQFASVDRNVSSELGLNLISTGATNTIGIRQHRAVRAADIVRQPDVTPLRRLSAMP